MKVKDKKKTKNKWRRFLYFFTILYLLLVIFLFFLLNQIPVIYQDLGSKDIANFKENLEVILKSSKDKKNDLDLLIKKIPSEVVISSTSFNYQTINILDFKILEKTINNEALSYKSSYVVDDYNVWVSIYLPKFQGTLNLIVNIITSIIIVLSLVIIVVVSILFKGLVDPLRRLRTTISKIRTYDLKSMDDFDYKSEYDVLNNELSIFGSDLKDKIDDFIDGYSALEKDLQVINESNVYKTHLAQALVHDLKTPVNTLLLESEILSRSMYVSRDELKSFLGSVDETSRVILDDVDNVLKIISTDKVEMVREDVDVVKIMYDSLKLFKPFFDKKKIFYVIDSDESLVVNMNVIELKQIMHNIISNVSQYAKERGSFEFRLDLVDGVLVIESFNDVEDVSIIDFDKIFDLFYHSGTGSGVGMYTILKMVEVYNGTCSFERKDDGVMLKVLIPVDV